MILKDQKNIKLELKRNLLNEEKNIIEVMFWRTY